MTGISSKNAILAKLYEYMSEDDWLDGIDLYQNGNVTNLKVHDTLVTAKVSSFSERQPSEVRIKVHPTGGSIQWLECTCRKNRVSGQYCEHIGSTMFYLDREKPKFFANLDPKIPFKAPQSVRKKPNEPIKPKPTPKKDSAMTSLLDHFDGQIHSIELINHGPQIRVRVEVKSGQLTSYDLNLDESADFYAAQTDQKAVSAELKKIGVFELESKIGTFISQDPISGEITAQRSLAIDPEQLHDKDLGFLDLVERSGSSSEQVKLHLFSSKSIQRYIGTRYSFIPGIGYFRFQSPKNFASWNELPISYTFKNDAAAEFLLRGFREYAEKAVIWLDQHTHDQVIHGNVQVSTIQVVGRGIDWYSIMPEFKIGDESISMIDVIEAYRASKSQYMRAKGKWIKIPDLVKQYGWNVEKASQTIKVDKLQLMRIKAEMGEFDRLAGSKEILTQLTDELTFLPEKKPPELTGTHLNLREYQLEGYSWMWWLFENRLSGLLADEMGLGKTHQAMALMSAIKNKRSDFRFLVICPTTVLDHWYDKIMAFSPNLNPFRHYGPKRLQNIEELKKPGQTVLSSYGIVMRDIDFLSEMTWDVVILDEAHFVKNIDTATYKAVCKLRSASRYCLSGTPMENHLGELKAVYDFLLPGYLGSQEYFKERFINQSAQKSEDDADKNPMTLQKLIHPFKMRRTKELVLKDLPEKVEDLRHCQLSEEQAAMYRQTLDLKARPILEIVKDESKAIPFLHVFSLITLLKQICDHPAMLTGKDSWRDHQSGKFELFKELLDEAMESGHKVVVYSQYLDMLAIISGYLEDQKIPFSILTGSTKNRGEVINNFQNDPNVKVFCASLLAGGIGIDLTAASVVIHYDRWWNASKENQATDRVHRIGQNKNVQVLKLVTRDTLEERIDALINKKKALFEKFLDHDEEMFKTLTRGEIIDLLQ